MIRAGWEHSTLREILGAKINFLACFFFKHKNIWFCPWICKILQSDVNFKGIKLALKNLGRFSSPTVSRAVLRDKYKHFDLYLKDKTLKYKIKVENILILRGQNALEKQKILFLLLSSSNGNINTVWKLKNF